MNPNVSFILGLYAGLLDRMPDPTGLKYWVDALDSGAMTREHVVTSFFNSPEFQGRSNSGSLHEIVSDFYSNAFNRPADPEGLAWWTAQIDAGVQMDQIIIGLLSVVEDPKNADGQRLQNAIDATLSASAIYQQAGVTDYWVSNELDGITADANSVAMFNYEVQQSVGINASLPAVVFDNVIKGDDFPVAQTLEGTALNDYIILGRNTQIVYGKDGDDQFIGTKYDNTFYPGNGGDTVEAGAGNDIIDARNDLPSTRRDVFYGQDGNDSIYGGASGEYIDGGDGDDLIDTGAGNDVVRGGIGNDRIIKSGPGEFNLLGEAGDDSITVEGASRGQIYGDAGNDTINLNKTNSWEAWTGSGNDVVNANSSNYGYLYTDKGNDKVTLSGLHDVTVYLGDGDDTVELNNCENVKVYGGYGKDTFRVTNSSNLLLVGENDEDSFFVDATSLKTGTVNLRGWTEERAYTKINESGSKIYDPSPLTTPNNLTVTGLNHGDVITFNDQNFRNISNIKFDYSQYATITFDKTTDLGRWVNVAELVGEAFSIWGFRLDLNDINSLNHDRINSQIILKADAPFIRNTRDNQWEDNGDWWLYDDNVMYINYSNNIHTPENFIIADIFFNNLTSSTPLVGNAKSIDGALYFFG